MISKAQIKLIRSLQQKKYRKIHGLFIAEGTKIVTEVLAGGRLEVEKLYATTDWLHKYAQIYSGLGKQQAEEVDEKEMAQISALSTPQEVLALIRIPEPEKEASIEKEKLSLALDGIRDPGNMGTILRLADWYGVKKIFCSEDCVDIYNPKVVQATMGSIGRVTVMEMNLEKLISSVNVPVYAAVLDGQVDLHRLKEFHGGILLIGNESAGLKNELIALATQTVTIPRFGEAESLNAAVATGIILDNLRRVGE